MGFRLAGGAYQVMEPAADGSHVSDELGLRLCPAGSHLGLYELRTGARLLPVDDALRLLEETQSRVEEMQSRVARTEHELAQQQQKSAELEAEVERLRKVQKRRRQDG
jgi:septal ring factor EnvC (AmiA/AmiB activator)